MGPPPWIQTITGSLSSIRAGVKMLTVRQFSELRTEASNVCSDACGQEGPNLLAAKISARWGALAGAGQRADPIGDAVYGMPMNLAMSVSAIPYTWPSRVRA